MLSPEEDWKHRDFSAAVLSGLKNICRDYAAGKTLVCVFVGESGSGKTLAAAMIAKETGQSLYRVDLGAVIQKYAEEPEKPLQQLLDRAEAENAILFFDQADVLFADRAKQSTGSDHLPSSYTVILDRVGDYPGIVIMVTSTKPDYGWLMRRKYRYIIDFYKVPSGRHGT